MSVFSLFFSFLFEYDLKHNRNRKCCARNSWFFCTILHCYHNRLSTNYFCWLNSFSLYLLYIYLFSYIRVITKLPNTEQSWDKKHIKQIRWYVFVSRCEYQYFHLHLWKPGLFLYISCQIMAYFQLCFFFHKMTFCICSQTH
jgi:hypothetical protein